MSRTLDMLRDDVEFEGYTPGTPLFERILVARKVDKCKELQGVPECSECRAYITCELVRQHMRNVKFGGDPE